MAMQPIPSTDFSNQSLSKMEILLSSYYGMDEERQQDQDTTNIDSSAFNDEDYVQNMMKSMNLRQLLEKNSEVFREIKALDSDMQMLVYENYNKFISATDTIRKMKNNVENMESEINSLLFIMSSISDKSNKVNERLAPRRAQVEKLVGVRRLLKRLEFIFELPQKLNKAIDQLAYAQAAKYFNVAAMILKRYTHIAAFRAISKEATEIMANLKALLLRKLEEDGLQPNTIAEYIHVLLQFNVAPQVLSEKFLKWYENRFLTLFDKYNHDYDIGKKTPILQFIPNINEEFLSEYLSMEQSYSENFIKDSEHMETFKKNLLDFTREIFIVYFATVMKQFERPNDDMMVEDCDVDRDLIQEYQETSGDYRVLICALQQFINDVSRADVIVPEARIHDGAVNVVEKSIRFQLDSSFLTLRDSMVPHVKMVFDKTSLSIQGKRKESSHQIIDHFIKLFINDAEEVFRNLQPLVRTAAILISEMGHKLAEVIQDNLRDFILWHNHEFLSFIDPLIKAQKQPMLNLVKSENSFDIPCKYILILSSVCKELAGSISPIVKAMSSSLPGLVRMDPTDPKKTKISFDVTSIIEKTNKTSFRLLEHYVDLHGRKMSCLVRENMEQTKWLEIEEPRDVRGFLDVLLTHLGRCAKEASEVLNQAFPFQASQMNNKDFRRYSSNTQQQEPLSMKSRGLEMDIERMFTRKVVIHGIKEFSLDAILIGVLKITLKTFIEYARMIQFSKFGFQQLQVEMKYLELMIPLFVNETHDLSTLLNQAISSAADRCTEEPVRLPHGAIAAITSTKKAKFNLEF